MRVAGRFLDDGETAFVVFAGEQSLQTRVVREGTGTATARLRLPERIRRPLVRVEGAPAVAPADGTRLDLTLPDGTPVRVEAHS
ncbi:hypothetical protein [Streptomyces aurantiogriseus]|uniref:Uncharacterized protein n=1 Tax=Streptomyces aurantiogriseus TaxID=66870 RepID=A0A918F3X7_9ACTN|nr:hypothetical protein [Streptomyces aurantiogriseus]GGQ98748.1 hypothetical protein GCM10010251_12550 [Streptomyces aurantiogriseus]